MKMPFVKYEKVLYLTINYSQLKADEIQKIKEVLNQAEAEFSFLNSHQVSGNNKRWLSFEIPFLTKDQYLKLKGL